MNLEAPNFFLEGSRSKIGQIIGARGLLRVQVTVTANPLTPVEAIGHPNRRDFPIIEGKERVIEANVLGAKGHAFTDTPQEFRGTLEDVLKLELASNQNRAIFISTLNALLRYLGDLEGTVHCKDEDPEKCAREIANHIFEKYGKVKVGLIGLNPAIAEMLVAAFGAENVFITDLNRQNIDEIKFGVQVWDGRNITNRLIEQSDIVIVTGTTLVNGTFDDIFSYIQDRRKEYLIYGVTCAGICQIMELNRICPFGRNA